MDGNYVTGRALPYQSLQNFTNVSLLYPPPLLYACQRGVPFSHEAVVTLLLGLPLPCHFRAT